MARQAPRIALLAALVVVLLLAASRGALDGWTDVESLRARFAGMGVGGQLGFVVAYTLLQPFGVPGTVFILAAPLLWPWPVAFGLSMAGTMGASVVGFSTARFLARDLVSSRIPERLRRYEEALARRGFATVFWLRFVFWMPQFLHVFLGVSGVPFWTHLWGSLAGYVVPLLVVSYFGRAAFEAMARMPAWAWVATVAVWLVGVVVYFRARRERPPA